MSTSTSTDNKELVPNLPHTRIQTEQISPDQIQDPLKRKIIELELENFKLTKYKNLYLAIKENSDMITQKLILLESELAKCGKDVAALESVVEANAKAEVKTMEEIIDSMVFIVPIQKLGKKMFAREKVFFKFNGYTGDLEFIMTDTELELQNKSKIKNESREL